MSRSSRNKQDLKCKRDEKHKQTDTSETDEKNESGILSNLSEASISTPEKATSSINQRCQEQPHVRILNVLKSLARLTYGEQFHHYAAYDLSIAWDKIDLELWTITISGLTKPHCSVCASPYHQSEDCPASGTYLYIGPALLSGCLPGYTQSINALVWNICPKHRWYGNKQVASAAASAALYFSCGAKVKHVMEKAGIGFAKLS